MLRSTLAACGARALFWAAARGRREERRCPSRSADPLVPERLGTPEAARLRGLRDARLRASSARMGPRPLRRDRRPRCCRTCAGTTFTRYAAFGAWDGATDASAARGAAGSSTRRRRRRSSSSASIPIGSADGHRLAVARRAPRRLRTRLGARPPWLLGPRPRRADRTRGAMRSGRGRAPRARRRRRAVRPTRRRHAFALAHGYALGQLERVSSIEVDGRSEEFRATRGSAPLVRRPTATASSSGPTAAPERPRRRLRGGQGAHGARRAGGRRHVDGERWDAARVREHEAEELDGGTQACSSRRR